MHFTPLILDNLDYAWGFSAELCPEGLIGIAGSTLRLAIFLLFSLRWFVVMRIRDRTALGHDETFFNYNQLFLLNTYHRLSPSSEP